MLRTILFRSALSELLPHSKLATTHLRGGEPTWQVAWEASRAESAEAAICFRGQLRGISTRDLLHVEEMVLSRLFWSGDVFAVIPTEECEAAILLFASAWSEPGDRPWALRQVICTPNTLSAQEERFASELGPPLAYSAKQNLAIEMRHLKVCGQATRKTPPYTWILLIRPDFTWCHSPSRSTLGPYILIPRETENEWFVGGSTESAVGPAHLMQEYCNWYDTLVRNETFWFVLRTLRLNTGSSLKNFYARFGPPFTHEQTLDLYLFIRQLPIERTSSFSRFRTSLCKNSIEHCCHDNLVPIQDSRGIWQNVLVHGMNPRFVARRVRAGYDFLLAGALVSFFRQEMDFARSSDKKRWVLDVGCGSGTYALELNSHSLPCLCLEGDDNAGHVIRMEFAGFSQRAVVADFLTWTGCGATDQWGWVLLLDVMHFHPFQRQQKFLEKSLIWKHGGGENSGINCRTQGKRLTNSGQEFQDPSWSILIATAQMRELLLYFPVNTWIQYSIESIKSFQLQHMYL